MLDNTTGEETYIAWTLQFDSVEMRDTIVDSIQADEAQKQNIERLKKYLAEINTV